MQEKLENAISQAAQLFLHTDASSLQVSKLGLILYEVPFWNILQNIFVQCESKSLVYFAR